MKNNTINLLSILAIVSTVLILFSCEKKDEEDCDDNCTTFSRLNNMVGYLQPRQAGNDMGLLYHSPGLLSSILVQLDAVEVDPGFYQMTMPLLDGSEEEMIFQASEVEQPALYASSSGLADELRLPHTVHIDAQCDIVKEAGIDTLGFDENLDRYVIREITKAYGECIDGDAFCISIEQIYGQMRYYVDSDYSIQAESKDLKFEACAQ